FNIQLPARSTLFPYTTLFRSELIGYNVYRDNDLYRFQTENTLYNFEQSSNCDEDFLMYNNGLGFYAHVTAVYNPGSVESGYTERSEEHTSELQSRENLVCRLL